MIDPEQLKSAIKYYKQNPSNKQAQDIVAKELYRMMAFLDHRYKNPHDPDIAQEVVFHAFNKLDGVKDEGNAFSFLWTTMRRKSIDIHRTKQTRRKYEQLFATLDFYDCHTRIKTKKGK